MCCGLWSHKEPDPTERLNHNNDRENILKAATEKRHRHKLDSSLVLRVSAGWTAAGRHP